MVILMLEHVPAGLRGTLTRWMIEPRPGVFVGKLSAMVRDKLWEAVQKKAPEAAAVLIQSAATEQGFFIRVYGEPTRKVVDCEGVQLIKRLEKRRPPA